MSTRELEIACLDMCLVVRNLATSHVVVKQGTPHHSWLRYQHEAFLKERASSLVSALRAWSITWDQPPAFISEGSKFIHEQRSCLVSALRRLLRPCQYQTVTMIAWWPESLRLTTFGASFNHSISTIAWPTYLEQLVFGHAFNQPVQGVEWLDSLESLTFGDSCNKTLDLFVWPVSLTRLTLGVSFNLPIDRVVWTLPLQCLSVGHLFNQPIQRVAWPASLWHLTFASGFKYPIDAARRPASLMNLKFGLFIQSTDRWCCVAYIAAASKLFGAF